MTTEPPDKSGTGMQLAIMQPYFLPYLGYWQLINAVDRFVIYDDVNFIKRGWVNRNRILINGEPSYITVPVQNASQNRWICDHEVAEGDAWREKILRTIELAYRKSPFFDKIYPWIESAVCFEGSNLADFLSNSIETVCSILQIDTEIVRSSTWAYEGKLKGQARIIDICRKNNARVYINPIGGKDIYEAGVFDDAGISLRFLATNAVPYRQRREDFIPHLSILDLLMEVGPDGARGQLQSFSLIDPCD